jgi:hypothetical protein
MFKVLSRPTPEQQAIVRDLGFQVCDLIEFFSDYLFV